MQNIPIPTLHLFTALENKLMELLGSLSQDDWSRPTVARLWNVKDVAAHLLDGNVRTLSMGRDGYQQPPGRVINGYTDLVTYLNDLNGDWVNAMRRVSPQVLINMLQATSHAHFEYFSKLDPFAPSMYAVSWAGQETSPNWFHIAREYTERWHHQQQIREAVNRPGITSREFYYPVLDTFMQALPYAYRNTDCANGTAVKISITGEAGADWFLVKKDQWQFTDEPVEHVAALVKISQEVAWKLFTKSWRQKDAAHGIVTEGSQSLLKPVLEMVTVMA